MTDKQRKFCDEYLIDCNATQAAIRAGYSEKTAEKASDWINEKSQEKPSSKFNAEMRAYIDEQLERIHSEKTADAKEVIEYLTSVLRGESESEVVVVEQQGDYTSEARNIKKRPDEKERLKAAELLGKRFGLFTDKVELNGVAKVVFEDDLKEDAADE